MFRKLALLLAVIAATCVGAQTGHATTYSRTFVSNAGVAGNTAEGCSAASPCDTFAHALSVTSAGGEINCLNAGDFGTVAITISVTIDCEGTSNGGIALSSGNAIAIVQPNIVVNLIGLDLDGEKGSSGNGVYIAAPATVIIRNCKIYDFGGIGIYFTPNGPGGILIVDNAFVANNAAIGINEAIADGAGNMTVRNSTVTGSQDGIQVVYAGGTHAGATIEQTTLAFNTTGLSVSDSIAVALIGGSTIVNNGTGVETLDGGVVYSFKNNQIGGNGTDGTPLTAYPGGPLN